MGDVPDAWRGEYNGNLATAPTDWKQYKWYKMKGEKGDTGDPATLVSAEVTYQVSDSGTILPSGEWSTTIPVVAQGKYLWTRIVQRFNTGDPVTAYTISRMGMDGLGSVSSVCGISPDAEGNVALTASAVGALADTGGDLTGELRMNGQPITGLNDPVGETEAARKGYVDGAVRKAAPRNLLDNSDFRNPVNQRGESAYSFDSGYTIDRWFLKWSGNGTLTINDGYIRIYRSTYSAYLLQNLPNIDRLTGKTVTVAAKVRGKGYVGHYFYTNGTVNRKAQLFDTPDWSVVGFNFTVPDTIDTYEVNGIELRTSSDCAVDCQWIALYEGEYTAETLPEYQPKGYAAELLECQRYYYQPNATDAGWALMHVTERGYMMIPLVPGVQMRVNPSIVIKQTMQIFTNPNGWIDIDLSLFYYTQNANMIFLTAKTSDFSDLALTAGMSYLVRYLPALSADL